MTKQEVSKLLAVLQAAYPGVRIAPERAESMVSAWSDLLSDLTYEQCNAALRHLLQTRTFMPSVAEIRAGVAQLTHGRVRSGGEAWGGVVRAMRQEGAYRTPGVEFSFSDPVTARCVMLMDWQYLCLSEATVADRARFIELYDQLARAFRDEVHSPALAQAREVAALRNGPEPLRALLGGVIAKANHDG